MGQLELTTKEASSDKSDNELNAKRRTPSLHFSFLPPFTYDCIRAPPNLTPDSTHKSCSNCHWILYLLACILFVCVIKLFIASTDVSVISTVPAPEKLQRQNNSAYIKQLPRPPPGTCGQVYLFGGGKSGSTTLWFTLTGGPGGINNELNSGPFPTQSYLKERGMQRTVSQWATVEKLDRVCNRHINLQSG
jgi:hypothetical protein